MKSLGRLISAVSLTAAALFAMPAASFASAVLVDEGSYTYDSTSGLDWLDVSATAGLSYDQVENNQGVNYIADGWHYATLTDIENLSADIGITFAPGDGGAGGDLPSMVAGLSTLEDMFGLSRSDSQANEIFGIYGTPAGGAANLFIFSLYNPGAANADTGAQDFAMSIQNYTHAIDVDGTYYKLSSFLVRDADVAATPLPGSSLLFASGIGLIGFVAWRRKRADVSAAICA